MEKRKCKGAVGTDKKDAWFFLYGFSKIEKENIVQEEKRVYKELALEFLRLSLTELDYAVNESELLEAMYEETI